MTKIKFSLVFLISSILLAIVFGFGAFWKPSKIPESVQYSPHASRPL